MLENLGRAVRSDPRDGKALGGYVNLLNIDGATVLERSGDKVAATGVRWTKNGSTYEATAAREVVLAAGSIASPQLLEVSGIGDEWLLRQHGIEVFVDNPHVGENLQGHVYVPLGGPGVPTKEDYANATYFQEQLDLYIQNKTGRLSSAGASSVLLSLKQIASTLDLDTLSLGAKTGKPCLDEQCRLLIRDLKSKAIAQELNIEGGMSPLFSSDTTKFFSANAPGNFSADPAVHPKIDPRYLSNPADVSLLKAVALHLQTAARTKPLSDLLRGDGTVYQPGYHQLTAQNVEEWVRSSMQACRANTKPAAHAR
ncbi:GMC oxidoreductase [Colletotrichum asianum]|uniref:GMC oxidoreductase n=1 Tax=Colletotrichum asianum TaxID=702518 RepID=A0A8H3WE18_9PEZI|nr:GMC oxidoreductase [Colletotrichum asianum]